MTRRAAVVEPPPSATAAHRPHQPPRKPCLSDPERALIVVCAAAGEWVVVQRTEWQRELYGLRMNLLRHGVEVVMRGGDLYARWTHGPVTL